ncbi:MAG TPA: hypothetical protein VLD86_08835, partial [Ilumatobacteraceae bacterium]|nr:hypothetical protein [Ilumatobacteraceae bacterium]
HQLIDDRHSTISRVTVTIGGTATAVDVAAPGAGGASTITFPAATASSLTLSIDDIVPRTTVDRRYGESTVLPVAISEIQAPTISRPRSAFVAPECRDDLVQIDGKPLPVRLDHDALTQLLAGRAVDVSTCDGSAVQLAAGQHRLTTTAGAGTGIDVDRVVLRNGAPAVGGLAAPTVDVSRTRTTRTATVSNCPSGCWLILGEGFNDGWQATVGGHSLGAPRQIDGGFNGWWLPGASGPVTVTMRWTPQRTMWIGLTLAGLAVVACIVLIWRDRRRGELPVVDSPIVGWPIAAVPRRAAVAIGAATAVLAAVCISPKYGAIAAVLGAAIAVLRRPVLAGLLSILTIAGCTAVILRRQLRYHLVANPSWPAAFDDLHRAGLLAVVLLLAATLADECPPVEPEQVS